VFKEASRFGLTIAVSLLTGAPSPEAQRMVESLRQPAQAIDELPA
jgi:hypothetical protein